MKADTGFPKSFTKAVHSGKLFQFGFSYRGGIDHDPAFVLADEADQIWLLVTSVNNIRYMNLEQAALCGTNTDDDSEEDEDTDTLDFGML